VIVGAALLVAITAHLVFFAILARRAGRNSGGVTELVVQHCRRPGWLMFPTVAVLLAWPSLQLPQNASDALRHVAVVLFVFSIGWAFVAAINVVGDFMTRRYSIDHADNLDARRIRTQTQVLRRIGVVLTVIVTAGIILMSIPSVRHIGVSLFASAGVAGLAVGLAARATLSNIVAGIQVALTQPIRIDDVVIIEGEWGWIEEINTTYVVVRIWDLRRLVVPISYFIEKPYQNWTRTTADLLGSVFLHVDYTVPFEEIRAEFRKILEASGQWDGKVAVMHVTEARERTVEIRMLMSAPSSPQAWELRCHVREKLIEYVRANYPDSLPRVRAEVDMRKEAA
jgi:small-conductance mechanosensitive channel